MASSKKKKSSKKPVAKVAPKAKPKPTPKAKPKPTPKAKPKPTPKAKVKATPTPKAKAKPAATPKATSKPKPAASTKAELAKAPTHADAWGNASLKKRADAAAPMPSMTEPSGTPTLALEDHEPHLVSPANGSRDKAVKDEDPDHDGGSPRLDDRLDNHDDGEG